MLTVTGLWFDHERTPVGLDHTPVFGWQLEGNCRNIRQTQYRLQVALMCFCFSECPAERLICPSKSR